MHANNKNFIRHQLILGLILISLTAIAQKKIIPTYLEDKNHFELKLNRKFLHELGLEDLYESKNASTYRFRIDPNKIVEIRSDSSDWFTGTTILYTTSWSEQKLFLTRSLIDPDTVRLIHELIKTSQIDSLSQINSEYSGGAYYDGLTYVIEVSSSNFYSLQKYRLGHNDRATESVTKFMRSLDNLLNLKSKLLIYINGLPREKCYRIQGEIYKVICPGNLKKEKRINNEK